MTYTQKEQSAALYPLDEFYAAARMPMPRIQRIPGDAMPRPYRNLLVHEGDMTPTLEHHHGVRIHLRVLGRREHDGALFREVVLVRDDDESPVEFGAIRINLARFPEAARGLILQCRKPLGTILGDFDIPHESHPNAYFSVTSDSVINDAFSLGERTGVTLYGRHNVITDPDGHALAHVVEILPPMEV